LLPPPGQVDITDLQEEKCQEKEKGRKQVLASMVPSPGADTNWTMVAFASCFLLILYFLESLTISGQTLCAGMERSGIPAWSTKNNQKVQACLRITSREEKVSSLKPLM
jgi:hypothetical protein